MKNITESSKKQEKFDPKKLRKTKYNLVDGKLIEVSNPDYDPEYAAEYDKQNKQAANKAKQDSKQPGKYDYFNSKVNKWIKNYYLLKLAREKHHALALNTPTTTNMNISESDLIRIFEQEYKSPGKDRLTFKTSCRLIFLFTDYARRFPYLQISQAFLAKTLKVDIKTIKRSINFLRTHKIIKTIKAHLCISITQISHLLITPKFLSYLKSFATGYFAYLFRDVPYIVNYDIKKNNNENVILPNVIQNQESIQENPEGRRFLQNILKKLNICTPVLCP